MRVSLHAAAGPRRYQPGRASCGEQGIQSPFALERMQIVAAADMGRADEDLRKGGAAIGATLVMVGGPGGSLIGGVVGGVLGGIAGKDISTPDHPDHGIENSSLLGDHDKYWREEYQSRPYYSESRNVHGDLDYDRDYRGAYQLGYENREHYSGKEFNEAEPDLRSKWEQFKGESRLTWEQAKYAVKDAWDRTTR